MSLSKLRLFHGRLKVIDVLSELGTKKSVTGQVFGTNLMRYSSGSIHQVQLSNTKKLLERSCLSSPKFRNFELANGTSLCCNAASKMIHSKCYYSSNAPVNKQTNNAKNVSEKAGEAVKDSEVLESSKETESSTETASPSVFTRFKNAYKEYGKVLIGVHVATSCVWFGCFYYAAKSGLDVVPLLERLGAGETVIKPFKSTGVGNVAVGYLLYKLATPARYTVTIVGTQLTSRMLRNMGYMKVVPKEDSFRQLMKDGRNQIKEKTDILKERTSTQLKEKSLKIRSKSKDMK